MTDVTRATAHKRRAHRALRAAALLVLLSACGGAVLQENTRTAREARGTSSATSQPTTHASDSEASAMLGARGMRETEPETPEEPSELRSFTLDEVVRIRRVQRFVDAAARKHGIEADLINAIIWVESKFEPRVRGKLGPRGLMQIMPRTGKHLAIELHRRYQPYSADFNIDAGTYYFSRLLEQFGEVSQAIAAYNAGPGTITSFKRSGDPLPQQIQNYVAMVLRAQRAFADRDIEH